MSAMAQRTTSAETTNCLKTTKTTMAMNMKESGRYLATWDCSSLL